MNLLVGQTNNIAMVIIHNCNKPHHTLIKKWTELGHTPELVNCQYANRPQPSNRIQKIYRTNQYINQPTNPRAETC